MRIAVVTKPNMLNHWVRAAVLDELRRRENCVIDLCHNVDEISPDTDRVLVFGGDGTMLESVRALNGADASLLGVNLGNLGFLTAFEQSAKPEDIVNALLNGKCVSRLLMDVQMNGKTEFKALNEIVIKSSGTRPITLELNVDGAYVDSYHSDGLIISSPTGSTAYSLSAGGPVLAPNVDAFVINPICAHSLHSRPLVVSGSSKVQVMLACENNAYISIDGNACGGINNGESVIVAKSSHTARFICSEEENFYSKLLQKMNRWGTTSPDNIKQ